METGDLELRGWHAFAALPHKYPVRMGCCNRDIHAYATSRRRHATRRSNLAAGFHALDVLPEPLDLVGDVVQLEHIFDAL